MQYAAIYMCLYGGYNWSFLPFWLCQGSTEKALAVSFPQMYVGTQHVGVRNTRARLERNGQDKIRAQWTDGTTDGTHNTKGVS